MEHNHNHNHNGRSMLRITRTASRRCSSNISTIAPIVAACAILGACTTATAVQCERDENCDRFADGQCTMSGTGSSWCTYPDTTCESGRRWSDLDVGDGLEDECVNLEVADAGPGDTDANDTDASDTDASAIVDGGPSIPDATSVGWDVAYTNTFDTATNTDASAMAVIINTGMQPLDLSTLEISMVEDDAPASITVNLELATNLDSLMVPAGRAVGLVQGAAATYVDPLVPELNSSPSTNLLRLTVTNVDISLDPDFVVSAQLSVAGLTAPLMFSMFVDAGAGITVPTAATRISAQ